MNLRSKMLLLKRWKRIKLFVEKLGSFRSNLWTNNGKQEENKCWFSTILMGSSIKKVVFDENRWSKFYTNLKCQFVLFNSLCPRQMYLKCQYELPLSWHITEDLQPLSPPDWGLTSGSHYWKLFRLWSDVRKLLCSDTQPSITMRITQLAQVTGAVFQNHRAKIRVTESMSFIDAIILTMINYYVHKTGAVLLRITALKSE